MSAWVFQPLLPGGASLLSTPAPATNGYVKAWTGTSWELKPIKIWTGTSWEIKPIKYWDGSSWIII